MRKGIHRGFKSQVDKEPRRAWVAETTGDAGEWLLEADYRAGGYAPSFDSLPMLVAEAMSVGPANLDDLPEVDREFVREYLERNKNA